MLEIPDWVPPSVAAIARELHGRSHTGVLLSKALADAVERLACDPRMRRVWQELSKGKRSGPERGRYVHPAKVKAIQAYQVPAGTVGDTEILSQDDKVQDQAFAILFGRLALYCSWKKVHIGPRARTSKEGSREIGELRSAAERIGVEAKQLRTLELGYLSRALEEVAVECLAMADLQQKLNSEDVLVVDRNSSRVGDEWARGFIINTAHIFEDLFGQKMQGLVAVLANVALEKCDITESRVNGMFRSKGVS
jgi:hypothetical protein